jgi:hypothetical protein
MNRQEPKSPAYIVLVRRLAGYLVDILLLFAAIVITQFGLEALTGGLPLRLLTTGPRIQGWVWLSVSLPTTSTLRSAKALHIRQRLASACWACM